MGAFSSKHKPKIVHVTCASRRSPSTSSDYSSDSEDSGHSSEDSDGSTNRFPEERAPTMCAVEESENDSGVYKYNSTQGKHQKVKPKESNFIETSEFPYARAKLVHPQTRREHQEARSEERHQEGILSSGQQTFTTIPSLPWPKQHERDVMFPGPRQSQRPRTINPHILWSLHSNGSGINVVPCTEVSHRSSDHMPVGTWRNPNRAYTYFREQNTRPSNEPLPTSDDVHQYDRCARAVRPPTPCVPVNTKMWSGAANSGEVLGYSEEERKALIRAQYKVELEAIRQMTNPCSRVSTTGHR